MNYILNYVKTHKHCLILLYFLFYLPSFFILEKVDTPITIIHCPLDDMIPFIAPFIFPYFLWYFLFPSVLIFFMIKDKEDFMRLCFVMFGGMTLALITYAVFPNGLNLRVTVNGSSLSEKICVFLYSIDTPSNVFPSIHVSSTAAISLTVYSSNSLRTNKPVKILLHILSFLIIISTMFVKQHSVYDVLSGLIMSLLLWLVSFRISFKGKSRANIPL